MYQGNKTTAGRLFYGDIFICMEDGQEYTFIGLEETFLWVRANNTDGTQLAIEPEARVEHIACTL